MKSLVFIALTVGSILTASAQNYQFRNQYGQVTGSAQWNGNGYQFRNEYGQTTGSSQWTGNGWQLRNQYGQPTGSVNRGW
jgi:hypothetical protein